jgi:hypothetical protein
MTILLVEDSRLLRVGTSESWTRRSQRNRWRSRFRDGPGELVPELDPVVHVADKTGRSWCSSVLRALKHDPQTAVIPVIVLTGLGAMNESKLKKKRATARFHKIGCALPGQFPTHCFTLSRTCWASKKRKDPLAEISAASESLAGSHSAAVQDCVNFLEQRTSIDWFRQELSFRYRPGREGGQVAGVSRHE